MDSMRGPKIVLLWMLVFVLSVSPFWASVALAAPTPSDLTQPPPPEPPSEPPPGAGGNVPDTPPEPYPPSDDGDGGAEPYIPPTDEESSPDPSIPPDEEATPEEAEPIPAMPYQAPVLPALPDPSSAEEGSGAIALPPGSNPVEIDPSGGEGEAVYQIVQAPMFREFAVYVDRGCNAIYTVGDSIEFSVAAEWQVYDPATQYWRYLEVWGSTNNAWWHQVIPGRWVAPRDSIARSGYISRPVGDELIYARLLDQSGLVLNESTCRFTSQEVNIPPLPPAGWTGCGETQSGYVEFGTEHVWSFSGNAGRHVVITLFGSYGFDTYLELFDPYGGLLRENDDISGANLNSRISVVLPYTGVYTIVAHGYDHSAGSYSLSLSCY